MTPTIRHGRTPFPARGKSALVGVVLVGSMLGLTGCSHIIKAVVNHATHGKLDADEAAVNGLSTKMKAGESATFVVTYVTTGNAPATIKVAASPPKDFAFVDTQSSGTVTNIIQNSTGSYICSKSTGSGSTDKWACTKLTKNTMSTANTMKLLYTGQYWIDFLSVYRYAGVAGVSIKTTSMTVNGYDLSCIVSSGSAGATTSTTKPTSFTVCVTTQGVLGYVNVSNDSTAFEIKSYSTSPPSSLYETPPGATITTIPTSTT